MGLVLSDVWGNRGRAANVRITSPPYQYHWESESDDTDDETRRDRAARRRAGRVKMVAFSEEDAMEIFWEGCRERGRGKAGGLRSTFDTGGGLGSQLVYFSTQMATGREPWPLQPPSIIIRPHAPTAQGRGREATRGRSYWYQRQRRPAT